RKHQGIDKSGFKNNIKFFDTVSQAILQLQY
ncbi:MAG: MerR family transcriptional regulator, partial [Croceibacter sp.]|nr:MerR family transcriptional regulator [Croceibacter sp.]